MQISRAWAMPSKDTFNCKPIGDFVRKYLAQSKVSIDPFARNKDWATYTNDLNPETSAQYHLYADKFLEEMRRLGIICDLMIFDPPYSLQQVKMSYASVGIEKLTTYDSQNSIRWTTEKNIAKDLISDNGIFLHFGFHTNGMGIKRGFEIIEVMVVAHGGGHSDTLCMAERKIPNTIQEFK